MVDMISPAMAAGGDTVDRQRKNVSDDDHSHNVDEQQQ